MGFGTSNVRIPHTENSDVRWDEGSTEVVGIYELIYEKGITIITCERAFFVLHLILLR
jgi:hypothetical protein